MPKSTNLILKIPCLEKSPFCIMILSINGGGIFYEEKDFRFTLMRSYGS